MYQFYFSRILSTVLLMLVCTKVSMCIAINTEDIDNKSNLNTNLKTNLDINLNTNPSSLIAPENKTSVFSLLSSISYPQKLDSLFYNRLSYYSKYPSIGYRVLIFSESGNNSGAAANQAKENFLFLYPDTPAYLSYESPYYKIKTGNFRTKEEASVFLFQIRIDYPHAFLVKDILDIPTLLNPNNQLDTPIIEESIDSDYDYNKKEF